MLRNTRLATRSIALNCFCIQRSLGKTGAGSSSASQLREEWVDEALFGIAPVFSALKAKRRKIYKLCIQEGIDISKRKDRNLISKGIAEAEQNGIEIQYCPKHDLNMIVKGQVHQGFLLDCSPLKFEEMEKFENLEQAVAPFPLWLALDEVFDPHNLGAMIRTAAFLGVDGILVSKKNSAPLTPVVSKVSSGALEFVPIYGSQKLSKVLIEAGETNWTVVGADVNRDAVNFSDFSVKGPTILVMGNEASGLRYSVKKACNSFVQIMPVRQENGVSNLDSLNVSVAAGILLSHLSKQSIKI
eukprot:g567.t1